MSACRLGAHRLESLVRQMGRAALRRRGPSVERLRAASGAGRDRGDSRRRICVRRSYGRRRRRFDRCPYSRAIARRRRNGRCRFHGNRRAGARQHQLPVVGDGRGGVVRVAMFDAGPHARGERRFSLRADRDGAGSLVDARSPAAVAAGNVETSMRIVDVLLGALAAALPDRIPAASQGTMNNVAMGRHGDVERWDYYETIGGGTGAHAGGAGVSAVHSHMTNTLEHADRESRDTLSVAHSAV